MEICKICNQKLKSSKGLGAHLKRHNITIEEYYRQFFMKPNEDKCVICGQPTNFKNITNGYFHHCSQSCAVKDEETQQKMIKTNLERLGVEHPKQSEQIKEKAKQTNLIRYGETNYSKTDESKQRIRQTKLEKYGNEGFNNYEKTKCTIQEKYNVDNVSQIEFVKEKREQTNLQRIGYKNPYQQPHIQEKARKNSGSIETSNKKRATYRKNIKNNTEKAHLRRIHNKNAKYQYDDIAFDSKWEYDVYKYCIEHNISIEREPIQILFNNNTCATYPDFKIDNILVEVKGDQFINEDGSWKNPYNNQDEYQEQRRIAMLNAGVKIWSKKEVQAFLNGDLSVLYN